MKTPARVIGVVIALTVCVGAVVFLTSRQTPSPPLGVLAPAGAENISFRLKWIIYSSFAHHFVALDKGYFAQERLNVAIQPGGAGLDPIKLVASGADDVGLAGYAQILLAREKGIPVIAIAEEYVKSGVVAMSLKNSGITKPQDFVGKTVGVVPGSDPTIVYQALMAKLQIDRSKLSEVPIGFDLTPLFEKKVDVSTVAYISNQPIVAEDRGFPVNVIDPADYGISVGGNIIFTSEKTLTERRPALKRFLRGVLRGIMDSQKLSDDDVVKIVLAHNDKLNEATERKIWKVSKDVLLSHDPKSVGLMPEETWKRTAEIFQQEGLLETVPDFQRCYTNELVQEILRDGLPAN